MTSVTSQSETHLMVDQGPMLQCQVPANILNLASSIIASGNVTSNVIQSNGYKNIAFSTTSTQAGTITIQRYIDAAGTIKQGAAITASLTANTSQVCNVTDNNPFQSFTVNVSNSGASTATLSNTILLLQSN